MVLEIFGSNTKRGKISKIDFSGKNLKLQRKNANFTNSRNFSSRKSSFESKSIFRIEDHFSSKN